MFKGSQGSLHGAGTGSGLWWCRQAGQPPPLLLNLPLKLSRIAEELMQLPRGSEQLGPSAHELQKFGPGLVQSILPLSHGGRSCVAALNQLVHHLVDRCQPLPPCCSGLTGELRKFLL